MKKITLITFGFLISLAATAQQTISFETSEGYSVGDLNGQDGWAVTGCGADCFVENQVITSEQASDGTQSLKISQDPDFGTQSGNVFGGFYNLASAVPIADLVISYDVRANLLGTSDFRFGAVGGTTFNFIVDFNFQGNIRVPNPDGNLETIGTWIVDTWYNIRAEITGTTIVYYINDEQVYASTLLTSGDLTLIRFTNDNYGGDAYLDNLRINDEALSIEKVTTNTISHFYNENAKILKLESVNLNFSAVEIFSILGQRVLNKTLTNKTENIDLSALNDGIYLAKINIGGNYQTIKFVKN